MLKTWPKGQVQTGQGEKSDHRKDMVILFISRYVTFVDVSMYTDVYMFLYFFYRKHNGTHEGYTQKNKVQLMASCMLCSRDFSNEEQLKTHLLQCVKEMTQFTCEVCSQVF